MTKKHFPKLFMSIVTFMLLCVMLAGCSNGSRVPVEGIDTESVYLSNGTVKVTTGDLYKTLKTNYGLDVLTKAINEVVFKDEIAKYNADKTNPTYVKYFEYFVDSDCYNTADKDAIEEMDLATRTRTEQAFLDGLKSYGVAIDYTRDAEGHYNLYQDSIAQYYIVDIAVAIYSLNLVEKQWDGLISIGSVSEGIKELYTEDELTDAIKAEIEETQTNDIVEYYKENYEKQGDMLGILIRFNDTNEYEDTLKMLRLKTYGGKWYQIPYSDVADYDKYYANYQITTETALTDAEIFAYFIVMYNFINSYRSSIVFDMGWSATDDIDTIIDNISKGLSAGDDVIASIVADCADADGEMYLGTTNDDGEYVPSEFIQNLLDNDANGDFVLEYDEFYDTYFSIYNHFFTTLKTTGQKFSTKGMSYTNNITSSDATFLGFKLAENEQVLLYEEETVTETDEDGEETEITKYNFVNDELKEEIIQLIKDEQVEAIVYNDYSAIVTARYNYEKIYSDKKLKIYDTDLQVLYGLNNSSYKSTSASSDKAVAVINGTEILASDLCDRLMNAFAPIVSLSVAFDQWLLEQYEDGRFEAQISEQQFEEACKNAYNYFMTYFANGTDEITDYKLPASIGKKAYMQLAFGESTMNDSINSFIKPYVLKQLFYANLDYYYENDCSGFDPYAVLATYAEKTYNNYFELSYDNLIVYIDMNGDEEMDDFQEYVSSLDATEAAEFKALICEFADEVAKAVNEGSTKSKGLSEFVTEYNKSSRFDDKWGKYKKAGLFVYLEKLSSDNPSIDNTEAEKYVTEFKVRIEEVYNELSNWDSVDEPHFVDAEFIPFFDHTVGLEYDKLLITNYGCHLLLFTDASNKPDSTFDSENTKYTNISYVYKNADEEIFSEAKVDNVFSTTPYPSRNQIEVYTRDYELYGENLNLPTDIYNNVKSSFANVYTRYTSSTHRTFMIIDLLTKDNFEFASNDIAKLVDDISTISKLQLDNYADDADNVFAGWFDAFNYNGKFAK